MASPMLTFKSPNIQTQTNTITKNGTETTKLLSKSGSTANTPYDDRSKLTQSFILAKSWKEEIKLTLRPCLWISLQCCVGWGTITTCIIMVGQLPNSSYYLSGVGLASTFVNVTGVAITWGFTTALFTLLPQAIGAGQTRLASIYVQRSFYIVTIVSILLSIIQFFAGDILIAIGQPEELREIMNVYCQILIPYIFLTGYAAILERSMQALNCNMYLFGCYLFQFLITPPFAYFFMYTMNCGYYGAAIARSLTQLLMTIAMLLCLIFQGYGYLFIPHKISTICTRKGVKQYTYLALPGLFQNAFEWIIEEVAVILAGYVVNPTVALSTCVILNNLFNVVILSFSVGVCNGTNLRVAKYIGYGSIYDAKRAAKVGILIGCVIIAIISLLFTLGRNIIPVFFTPDKDVIDLTSQMIMFLIVLSFGCIILQTVGGIYRGLGQQIIAAIFVFVSYWIIAFPICFILLFAYGLRENLYYGVILIIGNLTLGNLLSAIGTVVYLIFFIDWNVAVNQSNVRVKSTMREYNSTKIYDANATSSINK